MAGSSTFTRRRLQNVEIEWQLTFYNLVRLQWTVVSAWNHGASIGKFVTGWLEVLKQFFYPSYFFEKCSWPCYRKIRHWGRRRRRQIRVNWNVNFNFLKKKNEFLFSYSVSAYISRLSDGIPNVWESYWLLDLKEKTPPICQISFLINDKKFLLDSLWFMFLFVFRSSTKENRSTS